jgi:hypothetical protein
MSVSFKGNRISGERSTWMLSLDCLGSGDAGEVYLVEEYKTKKTGVLKRPSKSAFKNTQIRQATQIEIEGKALNRLGKDNHGWFKSLSRLGYSVSTCGLLDFAAGAEQTGEYFIISEVAPGLSFSEIHKETRKKGNFFPRTVLLTGLSAVFELLDHAHSHKLIWNDVKPDHIFWDTKTDLITFIDWGNAIFLKDDMISEDLRHSWRDDYLQVQKDLGTFLKNVNPQLYDELLWDYINEKDIEQKLINLRTKINNNLENAALRKKEIKFRYEMVLRNPSNYSVSNWKETIEEIKNIGLAPNPIEIITFYQQKYISLIDDHDYDEIRHLCDEAAHFSENTEFDKKVWDLRSKLSLAAKQASGSFPDFDYIMKKCLLPSQTSQSDLMHNYSRIFWRIKVQEQNFGNQKWFNTILSLIRQISLGGNLANFEIYEIVKKIAEYIRKTENKDLDQKISREIIAWQSPTLSKENPISYKFNELLGEIKNTNIPLGFTNQYESAFENIQNQLNNFSAMWQDPTAWFKNFDTEKWEQLFHQLLISDPQRVRFLEGPTKIIEVNQWLRSLQENSKISTNNQEFYEITRQKVNEYLFIFGESPWLRDLASLMGNLKKEIPLLEIYNYDLSKIPPIVSLSMPWLVHEFSESLHKYEEKRSKEIDENIVPQVYKFLASLDPNSIHGHDSTWNSLRNQLGGYLQQYEMIKQLFIDCLSGNEINLSIFPHKSVLHPEDKYSQETYHVLKKILDWKQKVGKDIDVGISNTYSEKILGILEKQINNKLDWQIIRYISEVRSEWLHLSRFLNQPFLINHLEIQSFSNIHDLRKNLIEVKNKWDSLFIPGLVTKNAAITCRDIKISLEHAKNNIVLFRKKYSSADFVNKAYFQSSVVQYQINLLHVDIEQNLNRFSKLESSLANKFKNYDHLLPALVNICELIKEISKKNLGKSTIFFNLPDNFSKFEKEAITGVKNENIYSISSDNPFRAWLLEKSEKISPQIPRKVFFSTVSILSAILFIFIVLLAIRLKPFNKLFSTKSDTEIVQLTPNPEYYYEFESKTFSPNTPENQSIIPIITLTQTSENAELCEAIWRDYIDGDLDFEKYEKDINDLPQCNFYDGISTLQVIRDTHLQMIKQSQNFKEIEHFNEVFLRDMTIPRSLENDYYFRSNGQNEIKRYSQFLSEINMMCNLKDQNLSANRVGLFEKKLDDQFSLYTEDNFGSLAFEHFCGYKKEDLYQKLYSVIAPERDLVDGFQTLELRPESTSSCFLDNNSMARLSSSSSGATCELENVFSDYKFTDIKEFSINLSPSSNVNLVKSELNLNLELQIRYIDYEKYLNYMFKDPDYIKIFSTNNLDIFNNEDEQGYSTTLFTIDQIKLSCYQWGSLFGCETQTYLMGNPQTVNNKSQFIPIREMIKVNDKYSLILNIFWNENQDQNYQQDWIINEIKYIVDYGD